jgi:DNA-binding IscR family transcriptional regulator
MINVDACVRSGQCPSRLVWERLTNCIDALIDSITLRDMLEDQIMLDEKITGIIRQEVKT